MSAYEQRVEPPDRQWQYLLFAAEPYETIAFKVHISSADIIDCMCMYVYMYMFGFTYDYLGTYGVILRIVKAGCHPVAIVQVVQH